jgi:hypothetical protein
MAGVSLRLFCDLTFQILFLMFLHVSSIQEMDEGKSEGLFYST